MNNIVKQEDKRGGQPYPMWLIQGFQEVLDECYLNDLGLIGYPYTWERGHGTENWLEIKLDRALASKEFLNIFVEVKLTNMEISTSDHCPIFLDPFNMVYSAGNKAFRFENGWLREPMCRHIVEEVWFRFQDRSLQDKTSECAKVLKVRGNEITGSFKLRIEQCKNTMKRAKGRRDHDSVKKYKQASDMLNEVYNQREVFWK
ncbi:uncharacterized protein LOC141691183 [Apium graveolens]|uniref:uncharacterized protein LOC141691183 n=1 Tax=Apium graveolens TaxID=4045 RepID=UPI003D7ADAD0